MATSRTATTKWKRIRKRVIAEAKASGLTHCPGYEGHPCGRELDYDSHGQPNSVEADHIVPAAEGGPDSYDNARAICFTCNRTRGAGRSTEVPPAEQFPLDPDWLDAVMPVNPT